MDIGIKFLQDSRTIFESERYLATSDLIAELRLLEESPWDKYNRGNPISPRQISKLASEYQIIPKLKGKLRKRSYVREDFVDAWSRYLPDLPLTLSPRGDIAVAPGEEEEFKQPLLSPLNAYNTAKRELEKLESRKLGETF